jgi:hypothetical protein
MYTEQQRLRKKGLVETEKFLVGVGARLDRIKDLTDKADNTTSIKMSQDLTNTILLELLAAARHFVCHFINVYSFSTSCFSANAFSCSSFE